MKTPPSRMEKTMIGTYCEPEFIAKIDAARGFKSRSQFCREAIREALLARGVEVPQKEIMPRDTTGRPRKRFPVPRESDLPPAGSRSKATQSLTDKNTKLQPS